VNRETEALRDYLKEKRDQEGILQQEQARKMGLKPEDLARYMTGKRQIKKDLQKILDYYGTTEAERRAIYRTQVSAEELARAEKLIEETTRLGGFQVDPVGLATWIKYGI
jgi:transcriptional regulator with XRE-family HTH domain